MPRREYASNLKNEFENTNLDGLTVHCDGKLLPVLTSKENVDRLPIVITCSETEKLLGVPKLTSGSRHNQAHAIYQILEEWNFTDKVQALSCDTKKKEEILLAKFVYS